MYHSPSQLLGRLLLPRRQEARRYTEGSKRSPQKNKNATRLWPILFKEIFHSMSLLFCCCCCYRIFFKFSFIEVELTYKVTRYFKCIWWFHAFNFIFFFQFNWNITDIQHWKFKVYSIMIWLIYITSLVNIHNLIQVQH